ncbi:hypothetical protein [Calycomorphotria hydatis]|uniref:Uncharacterized protein n=1 Tax=Calycomorphotria hydatis TaxID=2528027 RepID=A0A517T6X0_9PLAN|nr:hypothetical protein [Calycomorphotria hydatis]QDT64125.1 hypothetical protein V22_13560 [Calycomorphotria hydatis]
MKFSVAAIKQTDYKQLLIDHGEKFAFALICLLAVLALLVGTRWVRFGKAPRTFISQVEQGKEDLQASKWPEEEQNKYDVDKDIREVSDSILMPMSLTEYDYSTDIFWPIIPPDKPIEEPQWYKVNKLLASSGRAILALGPEQEEVEEEDDLRLIGKDKDQEPAREERLDDLPGVRARLDLADKQLIDEGAYDPRLDPTFDEFAGNEFLEDQFGGGPGVQQMASYSKDMYRRFALVRGIFPLRLQLEELVRAINLTSNKEAFQNLIFTDFQLQRQRAVPGDNPWDTEWQDVDTQVALDILKRTQGFDPDNIDNQISEAVFTMPLPARIVGIWGDRASHPEVDDYTLTEEGQKLQEWVNEQLLELQKQREQQEKELEKVRPRGFASEQFNPGQVRRSLIYDPSKVNEIVNSIRGDVPDLPNIDRAQLERLLTAAGQLLLFRYIDFEVEPANLYRYRVRLEILNPNYGRSADSVLTPDVAAGIKRWTEWSEPCDPVFIEPDDRFFLAEIDPGNTRVPTAAVYDIYQWHQDFGTPMKTEVKVYPGQLVGAVKSTDIIDPSAGGSRKKAAVFNTQSILLDIFENDDDFARYHEQELQLNPRDFTLPDLTLLVDQYGLFQEKDLYRDRGTARRSEQDYTSWVNAYQPVEKKTDVIDFLEGGFSPEDEMPLPRGRRGRSNIRRPTESGSGFEP